MKILKTIILSILKQLDKIALAAGIVLFIFILVNFLSLINKNYEKMNSSSISTRFSKYEPIKKEKYTPRSFFEKTVLWMKSPKRNKDKKSKTYICCCTDFMQPFKIARSIAKGSDGMLIPYENYLKGKCPISNETLPKPNSEQLSLYTSSYDYDNDGIPDVMEKKYGLNPESANDAFYDSDNDSFSNIVEYKYNKKGVLNPKIHPPLIKRIKLEEVANTKIPIKIMGIIKYGYNKDNWKTQINIRKSKGTWRTKFLKIGDKFKTNDINYIIKDIQERYDSVLDPKLGAIVSKDNSVVILKDSLGQSINAKVKEPVFEPSRRVILRDLYRNSPIMTKVNNVLRLGNKRTGVEKYKLISVANNKLVFEREKNGKKFTVTKIPDYRRPRR